MFATCRHQAAPSLAGLSFSADPVRSRGVLGKRKAGQGILFVLYNDIAWQLLPLEMGFGFGRTCWRTTL